MMFEFTLDAGADGDRLHRVAQEIADHPDISGFRQLDEDRKVGAMFAQSLVRRAPDPLPTEDAATRLDIGPLHFKGMATMAKPFRPELPGFARRATLHQKAVLLQTRPVRRR